MTRRTALLLASLLATGAAHGQSLDLDAKGNLRLDAGDGSRLQTDTRGTIDARTPGARLTAARSRTSTQNIASQSGARTVQGDNVQRATIASSRVNIATGGGTATSTVSGARLSAGAAAPRRAGSLSYINAELARANFAGRNLSGVAFVNATLHAANFSRTVLVGADFTNAELDGADLRGANLRSARLTNASLSDARLDGAIWVDGRTCGARSVGGCR